MLRQRSYMICLPRKVQLMEAFTRLPAFDSSIASGLFIRSLAVAHDRRVMLLLSGHISSNISPSSTTQKHTAADVMLWRKKYTSAGILVGTTLAWILLEQSGFSLLTIVSDVLLILIVGLFVWANTAAFIHKPPPRIPELHLSEDMVISFASALRVEINKALAIAHDIALGKDLKVFLKVVAVLWGLSVVGGWFHFLTMIYVCVVLSHTIPVIYERYEDQIDSYTKVAMDEAHKHYRTVNDIIAKKFPKTGSKSKKLH